VNFFIDEARLNKNKFSKAYEEYDSLIDHLDSRIVTRVRIDESGHIVYDDLMVYTFQ